MPTIVKYNGVTISNVRTKRFDQTNVYDDSGTDLLYSKFTVRVQGYVHRVANPSTGVFIAPASPNSVATGERLIRTMLMENRKPFLMTLGNGYELLKCDPGFNLLVTGAAQGQGPRQVGGVDLNNGPKPISCNIVNIVGTEALIVEFEIEICKLECLTLNNPSGVLSNRWSMRDTVDSNWYTTRTINGRLRVNNVFNAASDLRGLVVPDLQPGFRRDSIECQVSPDGLTMDYTVTDKQFFVACPHPARTWSVQHTAETGNGFTHTESVSITLESDSATNKFNLFALAMEIADQRLGFSNNTNRLESARVVNYVDQNKVDLQITCIISDTSPKPEAGGKAPPASPFFSRILGDLKLKPGKSGTANYDSAYQEPMPAYGTADPFGIFISYLQSPCDYRHEVTRRSSGDPPAPPKTKRGKGKPPKVVQSLGELPTDPDVSSNFNSKASNYTHYEIEVVYDYVNHTVALPIARAAGTSAHQPQGQTASHTFIQMAPRTCKRKVLLTAQRYGKSPEIPPPDSFKIGGQTMMATGSQRVKHKAPRFAADMDSMIYEVECEYQFAASHFPNSNEPIVLGVLPFDGRKNQHSQIAPTMFNPKLIGNVQPIA